ncbi:fanconi-associated nuclease 1 isoform X4 [Myotis daubentonii]|uniref:fanconi-associated nuclease 1 isoform X4 n=1 Tax=Myotis daubentonii TaxID=98922 RepID=UPI002873EB39|nr:fanconi-associated nuclease 1 isoform X4 [Myotis daubentonii]
MMPGGTSPARKRPRRSLSSSRAKKNASKSIVLCFNNAPPARLACPVCSQMVPRYDLNRHLDDMCASRGDVAPVAPGLGGVPGSDVAPGEGVTPERSPPSKASLSPDQSHSAARGAKKQTSPYFQGADGGVCHSPDAELRSRHVQVVPLGSLSSKLSRRCLQARRATEKSEAPAAAVRVGASCAEAEDEDPAVESSSQKENLFSCDPLMEQDTVEGPPLSAPAKPGPPQDGGRSALAPASPDSAPVSPPHRTPGNKLPSAPEASRAEPESLDQAAGEGVGTREAGVGGETEVPGASESETQLSWGAPSHSPPHDASEGRSSHKRPLEGDGGLKDETAPGVPSGPGPSCGVPGEPAPAPPGHPYYLRSFLVVLAAVFENEDDRTLFEEQEKGIVAKFHQLSDRGQKLYVRLFQRKFGWIKRHKLEYEEIAPDLAPVVGELERAGFLQTESELQELPEALELLSAPELRTLAKTLRVGSPGGQKQQLAEALLRLARQPSVCTWGTRAPGVGAVILKRAKDLAGPSLRVCRGPRAVFSRALLLFSLTDSPEEEDAACGGQGQLSTVLLASLGRVAFPRYTVSRRARVFQDRDDLLRWRGLSPQVRGRRPPAERHLCRHGRRELGGSERALSRRQEGLGGAEGPPFPEAPRGPAALPALLHRWVGVHQDPVSGRGGPAAAAPVRGSRPGTGGPFVPESLLSRQQRPVVGPAGSQPPPALETPRTGYQVHRRRAGGPRGEDGASPVAVPESPAPEGVAQLPEVPAPPPAAAGSRRAGREACDHHGPAVPAARDGQVRVCAGGRGARHPCHRPVLRGGAGAGPLQTQRLRPGDPRGGLHLHHALRPPPVGHHLHGRDRRRLQKRLPDSFFASRRPALEARLRRIHAAPAERLRAWVAATWEAQEGRAAAVVSWDRFASLQQAQDLVSCLGGPVLSGVCRRLAEDFRHCRGGLPDLVVWSSQDCRCKLVEVKGPNDRLSHKQMVWLDELQRLGADVEVCHVTAVGAKSRGLH